MVAEAADPNPDLADDGRTPECRQRGKSNFVAAVGNFNIQYNFSSASIAVQVLSSDLYLRQPLYPEPQWSKDVTLAAVFVGAMIGMLVMGRLGDVIGRSRALRVTTSLAILGAAIPACAAGTPNVVYAVLCLGRLVLGIGVGGIYPLSAVHSAEGSGSSESRGSRVSWAFFWQAPGVAVPYIVAMGLFHFVNPQPPAAWVPQFEFRLLFALGIVPGLVVLLSSISETESADFHAVASTGQASGSVLALLRREPAETRLTLVGTAGAWLCYDVAYYGTSVFTPAILSDICMAGHQSADGKCSQTLFETALQSVIVSGMSVPGCLAAIMLIDRMGSKRLNTYGFLLLAVNLAAMAAVYSRGGDNKTLLFVLFCTLTFFLNFGPNLGTFVLPAVCFPPHIRSTCHGISAFGGKLGAALGTLMFPPLADSSLGLPGVLVVQAALCVIGAGISQWFLKHDWEYLPAEASQRESASFLEGRVLRGHC